MATADGYYKASEQEPVYPIGSHNLGRVPQDKIDCWSAWMSSGCTKAGTGGAALTSSTSILGDVLTLVHFPPRVVFSFMSLEPLRKSESA